MTTLLEDLQALLAPLATGGAWYGVNTTQPPVYPYISYIRIPSTPNVTLQGPSTAQGTRVQIDIYAAPRRVVDAVAVETALEAALAASSIVNVPTLSFDLIDDATRAVRVIKEYSFWASN